MYVYGDDGSLPGVWVCTLSCDIGCMVPTKQNGTSIGHTLGCRTLSLTETSRHAENAEQGACRMQMPSQRRSEAQLYAKTSPLQEAHSLHTNTHNISQSPTAKGWGLLVERWVIWQGEASSSVGAARAAGEASPGGSLCGGQSAGAGCSVLDVRSPGRASACSQRLHSPRELSRGSLGPVWCSICTLRRAP